MEFYPGKLRIPVTPDLPADEARVERSFAALVEADCEAFVAEYEQRHGNVIDPDRARKFCPDYVASRQARGKYSRATYAPAKALTDEIFRRRIAAGPPGLVRFLSGGAGSGKTTVLAAMSGELADTMLVVDGTLSRLGPALEKIDFCLAHGCEVEVFHLHRPFAEAMRAIISRAKKTAGVLNRKRRGPSITGRKRCCLPWPTNTDCESKFDWRFSPRIRVRASSTSLTCGRTTPIPRLTKWGPRPNVSLKMQATKTKLLTALPVKPRPIKPAKRLAEKRADRFALAAVKALNRVRETGERPKVW